MDRQVRVEVIDAFARIDDRNSKAKTLRGKISKTSRRRALRFKEEKIGNSYQDVDLMTYLTQHLTILGVNRAAKPNEKKLELWAEVLGVDPAADESESLSASEEDQDVHNDVPVRDRHARNYARFERSKTYFENRKADPNDPLLKIKSGESSLERAGLDMLEIQTLERDTRNLPKHFMRKMRQLIDSGTSTEAVPLVSKDPKKTLNETEFMTNLEKDEPLVRNQVLLQQLHQLLNVKEGHDSDNEMRQKAQNHADIWKGYSTMQLAQLTAMVSDPNPMVLSHIKRLLLQDSSVSSTI